MDQQPQQQPAPAPTVVTADAVASGILKAVAVLVLIVAIPMVFAFGLGLGSAAGGGSGPANWGDHPKEAAAAEAVRKQSRRDYEESLLAAQGMPIPNGEVSEADLKTAMARAELDRLAAERATAAGRIAAAEQAKLSAAEVARIRAMTPLIRARWAWASEKSKRLFDGWEKPGWKAPPIDLAECQHLKRLGFSVECGPK